MGIDVYLEKYLKAIREAKTDYEIAKLIDRAYFDGFEDGANQEAL